MTTTIHFRVLMAALLLTTAALGQHHVAQTRVRRPAPQQVAADRAWPEFFKALRAAVSKRDRATLKGMMVRDFYFSGGGGHDNHNGDSRDEAFKFLDDPQVHGWQAFDKALAKGAVPSTPNTTRKR